MKNGEGLPKKSVHENEAVPSASQAAAQKLFAEMPARNKQDFLRSMRDKYSEPELQDMYGISPEDAQLYFHGVTRPKITIPAVIEPPILKNIPEHVPLTPENTHTVVLEDFIYPEGYKVGKAVPYEVSRTIQSVCSIADLHHKPFVQIVFANGTRVYTYKNKGVKGVSGIPEYSFEVVKHPDIVDDFE